MQIVKLKPPTIQDNPKPKKQNKKRKFEDDKSTPKINKIFLSVEPKRMSNNPLKITQPRQEVTTESYTDSTVGRPSKPVVSDDVINHCPDGAREVTCRIRSHVEPDLANK